MLAAQALKGWAHDLALALFVAHCNREQDEGGFFRGSEALRGLHWKGAPDAFSLVTQLENERITRKESMEPRHAKVLTPREVSSPIARYGGDKPLRRA